MTIQISHAASIPFRLGLQKCIDVLAPLIMELETENFTALKQHWHVYMMTYWGPLMTTKVFYLLCSIWVLLSIPLTMMYFCKSFNLDSVYVEQPHIGSSHTCLADHILSWSMALNQNQHHYYVVYLKDLYLVQFYSLPTCCMECSFTCMQLIVNYILLSRRLTSIRKLWIWELWLMTSVVGTWMMC